MTVGCYDIILVIDDALVKTLLEHISYSVTCLASLSLICPAVIEPCIRSAGGYNILVITLL